MTVTTHPPARRLTLAALAGLPQGTFASKVDVADGKVSVTSEPGKGSVFTLSLPPAHHQAASSLNSLVTETGQ